MLDNNTKRKEHYPNPLESQIPSLVLLGISLGFHTVESLQKHPKLKKATTVYTALESLKRNGFIISMPPTEGRNLEFIIPPKNAFPQKLITEFNESVKARFALVFYPQFFKETLTIFSSPTLQFASRQLKRGGVASFVENLQKEYANAQKELSTGKLESNLEVPKILQNFFREWLQENSTRSENDRLEMFTKNWASFYEFMLYTIFDVSACSKKIIDKADEKEKELVSRMFKVFGNLSQFTITNQLVTQLFYSKTTRKIDFEKRSEFLKNVCSSMTDLKLDDSDSDKKALQKMNNILSEIATD